MKILLATLHSKFAHSSLALPCLAAAAGGSTACIEILESTIHEPHDQTLAYLVAAESDIVAFSCYIWNIEQTLRLVSDLKKVAPETLIVLGGPEAGFGTFQLMESNPGVDCVIKGEGEETFAALVAAAVHAASALKAVSGVSAGLTFREGGEIVALPERGLIRDLDSIPSPFATGLVDLRKPLVYYETSRGCPFSCAFCMSSVESGVRSFSPARIEGDLGILMEKGAATVKLVDRTFNYDSERANRIWSYILRHNRGSAFHFEIAADLLTDENIRLLSTVPPGMFRFEIGVQSENEATLARVGRKSDLGKLLRNVERLREETAVLLHLDLVAGLPYEEFTGFLRSLHSLFTIRPHHIQVEPLKVLKGSPMRKIAAEDGYAFSEHPPYRILRNPWLSFGEIARVETIARLVELYYNGGRFTATLGRIASRTPLSSFFDDFAVQWDGTGQGNISQQALFEVLHRFIRDWAPAEHREEYVDALRFDYCRAEYPVANNLPPFLGNDPADDEERSRARDLIRGLALPRDSRIRTFSAGFLRDHRTSPPGPPGRLLFVYDSAAGRKMKVHVVRLEAGPDGAPAPPLT